MIENNDLKNLKIFGIILSRSAEKLGKFTGEIISDSLYKEVRDVLFNVLEPAYNAGLIKNYKIECTEKNNPNIYNDRILHSNISFQFLNEDWIDIEFQLGFNLTVNVKYKEQINPEFVPSTKMEM